MTRIRRRPAVIKTIIQLSFALAVILVPVSRADSAPAFQQGVADYNGGNYARALETFQSYKASYPNNALVHYYVALCQQGLGHVEQAKSEYKWVVDSRDPGLAAKAAAGLAQLGNIRGSGGGGLSGSSAPTATAPPGGSSSSSTQGQGKIKKVIDFWASW